jgi:hypothetical protein
MSPDAPATFSLAQSQPAYVLSGPDPSAPTLQGGNSACSNDGHLAGPDASLGTSWPRRRFPVVLSSHEQCYPGGSAMDARGEGAPACAASLSRSGGPVPLVTCCQVRDIDPSGDARSASARMRPNGPPPPWPRPLLPRQRSARASVATDQPHPPRPVQPKPLRPRRRHRWTRRRLHWPGDAPSAYDPTDAATPGRGLSRGVAPATLPRGRCRTRRPQGGQQTAKPDGYRRARLLLG